MIRVGDSSTSSDESTKFCCVSGLEISAEPGERPGLLEHYIEQPRRFHALNEVPSNGSEWRKSKLTNNLRLLR